MPDALIGHTGFVGGNLIRHHSFDATYNSRNIEEISGRSFDLLVCAGAPAVKWKANREPDADWKSLRSLMRGLEGVEARHVVLISTVDVYPQPVDIDERTVLDRDAGAPYGRHRLLLEDFIRDHFSATVLRLPGLFGKGLKKNVVYDFLHGNALDQIPPAGVFQFYSVEHLWDDIARARELGLDLLNVATEPVSVRDVAREAFGFEFENDKATGSPRYDMKSTHADRMGGANGYLYDRERVLSAMREFVEGEGWTRP